MQVHKYIFVHLYLFSCHELAETETTNCGWSLDQISLGTLIFVYIFALSILENPNQLFVSNIYIMTVAFIRTYYYVLCIQPAVLDIPDRGSWVAAKSERTNILGWYRYGTSRGSSFAAVPSSQINMCSRLPTVLGKVFTTYLPNHDHPVEEDFAFFGLYSLSTGTHICTKVHYPTVLLIELVGSIS